MGKLSFAVAKMRKGRSLLWSETRDGYLFILPWLIGFLIFTAGPMLASLYISLTRWEIVHAVGVGGGRAIRQTLQR